MGQLWLKFRDESGADKRIEVGDDFFTVGRHSDNDLTITDSRLSREHIRIERVDDDFFVSDPGSSNGTTINGSKLGGAVRLKDGDKLDLGGGLQIAVELVTETGAASPPEPPAELPASIPEAAPAYTPASAAPPDASGGIPTSFFILAPLLGLLVLAIAVGAFFVLRSPDKTVIAEDDDVTYSSGDDEETPDEDEMQKPTAKPSTPQSGGTPGNGGTSPASTPGPGGTEPPPANLNETAKVEQNGALFLRRIAQNEPKAFLTGDQAQKVNAKVKQIGKSSALAENINAARKNAAQIKTLAASKNLTPQFLAVAAITKLGSGRGDIMQAAASVADVYDKLATQIGSELGDDVLLMVAAYDQGVAGDTMKMRNMLQDLANKSTEGVRTIRSIWFLQKNGKISQTEFDRALNFLAIGTITQNPKEFGISAEALTL